MRHIIRKFKSLESSAWFSWTACAGASQCTMQLCAAEKAASSNCIHRVLRAYNESNDGVIKSLKGELEAGNCSVCIRESTDWSLAPSFHLFLSYILSPVIHQKCPSESWANNTCCILMHFDAFCTFCTLFFWHCNPFSTCGSLAASSHHCWAGRGGWDSALVLSCCEILNWWALLGGHRIVSANWWTAGRNTNCKGARLTYSK